MSDEEPVVPAEEPQPEPEPVHVFTPEEEEIARLTAIAENDRAVQAELKRLSRRGFIVFGASAVAGVAAWKWLRTRPQEAGVSWPFRRMLEFDESVAMAYFSRARLNPTYSPSRITRPARINGGLGMTANYHPESWRLSIAGAQLTLGDVRSFPRHTMITEFRCIEGWTTVVQWTCACLADVMAKFPPPSGSRYVGMETPDRGYYVGLDMESALHPQTLLAYEINGNPLPWQHGAPLRLAIPVKYGVKNIKRIGKIFYSSVRPADFWAEQGYDWYAGH